MSLTEKLSGCRTQFNDSQINEVMNYFSSTGAELVNRSRVNLEDTSQIQSALAALKAEYDKGTPVIKAALEQSIARLEKEYNRQAKIPNMLAEPLEIALILNSNEGNKELILPVSWDARTNYKEKKADTIVEKLYAAAANVMLASDLECDDIEWNGYVKIVSTDVANKNDMNHLQAGDIAEKINSVMKEDFDKLNIQVHVVQTLINSDRYNGNKLPKRKAPVKKTAVPEAENTSAPQQTPHNYNIEELINDYACVNVADAAEYLGINPTAARNKVHAKHLHAVWKKDELYIPMHDLVTYTASHSKIDSDAPQGKRFCASQDELNDEQFKAYERDVSGICTVLKAAEILGMSRSGTQSLIDKRDLHGVKYHNQWFIPKSEVEFVRKLRGPKAVR